MRIACEQSACAPARRVSAEFGGHAGGTTPTFNYQADPTEIRRASEPGDNAVAPSLHATASFSAVTPVSQWRYSCIREI